MGVIIASYLKCFCKYRPDVKPDLHFRKLYLQTTLTKTLEKKTQSIHQIMHCAFSYERSMNLIFLAWRTNSAKIAPFPQSSTLRFGLTVLWIQAFWHGEYIQQKLFLEILKKLRFKQEERVFFSVDSEELAVKFPIRKLHAIVMNQVYPQLFYQPNSTKTSEQIYEHFLCQESVSCQRKAKTYWGISSQRVEA